MDILSEAFGRANKLLLSYVNGGVQQSHMSATTVPKNRQLIRFILDGIMGLSGGISIN